MHIYKKEGADVVMNSCASIFWGTVNFETASKVSQIFGKTNQAKVNLNVSDQKDGISYGISTESKELLPASVMTTLTPGRFAGKIADAFEHPIEQKLIYGDVYLEDMSEDMVYTSIPKINQETSTVFAEKVDARYHEIIGDIEGILRVEGYKAIFKKRPLNIYLYLEANISFLKN